MTEQKPNNRASDTLVAVALFLVLSALYVLTSTTTMQLTSDEGVNLALVESMAKFGRFDVEQMATLTREIPAEHGLDGLHYSKYGLSQATLSVPFYWLAQALPGVGVVHVLLLFNAFVTAAAAVFVFLTARALGYGTGLAVALTLIYAVASPAWVYTKRYMSEPVSSLALVAGAYFCLLAVRSRWTWALAAGAALGVGVLNKAANAAFAPAFFLYLLLAAGPAGEGWRSRLTRPDGWRRAFAFAFPVALSLAIFAAYNYARFGNALQTGYGAQEGFNVPIYEGLAGLLLSPGKSVFIYFPLLLLLPFWTVSFLRRHRADGWLFLSLVVGHVLLYATWWIWWGGWNWGVRFLVPAWAFAVLLLAEGIGGLRVASFARRAVAGLLLLLSIGVQALGVAIDHSVYIASLMRFSADPDRLTLTDPARQPVLNQIRLLEPARLDFGWLIPGSPVTVDTVALGWLGGALAAALVALFLSVMAPRLPRLVTALGLVLAAFVLANGTYVYLERAYAREDGSARQVMAQIQEKAADDAALLYLAPRFTALWVNAAKFAIPTWGTYEEKELRPATSARLEALAAGVEEVWVVSEYPPGAPDNGMERWLAGHGFRQSERWYGPFRLASYRTAGAEGGGYTSLEVGLGQSIKLTGFALQDPTQALAPGGTLNLALRWQAEGVVGADYTVFVHLLDPNEKVYGQQDVAPGGGFAPTGGWRSGQVLEDRYAVPVDPAAPAGTYRIEIGMYDPRSGARLPVRDAAGAEAGNRVLLPVEVRVDR